MKLCSWFSGGVTLAPSEALVGFARRTLAGWTCDASAKWLLEWPSHEHHRNLICQDIAEVEVFTEIGVVFHRMPRHGCYAVWISAHHGGSCGAPATPADACELVKGNSEGALGGVLW